MATKKTPETIDALLEAVPHPLHDEIQLVRAAFLATDPSVQEAVKWNSVSFRNEHDFFATVHLRSTNTLQLVFHAGAKLKATAKTGIPIDDPAGLVEKWLGKDRALVTLGSGAALKKNLKPLRAFVKAWIQFV